MNESGSVGIDTKEEHTLMIDIKSSFSRVPLCQFLVM